MGTVNHAKVSIQGSYTSAALAAETFQMGINFAVGSAPPLDVGPPEHFFDVAEASNLASITGWELQSDFIFEGGVTDLDPLSWLEDDIIPAVVAWWTSARVASTDCRLDSIVVHAIGDNGLVLQTPYGPARAQATSTGSIVGAASGSILPLQIATVVSWETANITRKGKGRIFLPTTQVSALGTSGQFIPQVPTAQAAAGALLIAGMNFAAAGVNADAVVCAQAATVLSVIKRVRVGDVPDTQRRRRRQLVEAYTTVAV